MDFLTFCTSSSSPATALSSSLLSFLSWARRARDEAGAISSADMAATSEAKARFHRSSVKRMRGTPCVGTAREVHCAGERGGPQGQDEEASGAPFTEVDWESIATSTHRKTERRRNRRTTEQTNQDRPPALR